MDEQWGLMELVEYYLATTTTDEALNELWEKTECLYLGVRISSQISLQPVLCSRLFF